MPSLIFVYNAEGGIMNAALDSLHKIFSPSTYPCKLCEITFGLTSMRSEWKEYLDQLPQEKIFLHRSEFRNQYPQLNDHQLPAIFLKDPEMTELISSDEFKKINSIDELMKVMDFALNRN